VRVGAAGLVLAGMLGFGASVHAATIYESAQMGPPPGSGTAFATR